MAYNKEAEKGLEKKIQRWDKSSLGAQIDTNAIFRVVYNSFNLRHDILVKIPDIFRGSAKKDELIKSIGEEFENLLNKIIADKNNGNLAAKMNEIITEHNKEETTSEPKKWKPKEWAELAEDNPEVPEMEKKFKRFYLANNITFDGRKHQYKLDGIICAGVSSIAEYRPKDFLKFWAAKMVVEFLKDKQNEIKKLGKKEYSNLLYEAKTQHTKRSKDALNIGTRVHHWIEEYIKGNNLPIEDDIKNPVEEFLKFEKKHKIEWLAVEKIVCSPSHLVAGRLDAVAIVDGKVSLVDLKTSSMIDEGFYLQTAGYFMCLEEMGIKIDQRIILRLPKKKGDKFEAVLVDTPIDEDIRAFLNLRYAWQWSCAIDLKYKEEVIIKGYKQRRLKLKKL